MAATKNNERRRNGGHPIMGGLDVLVAVLLLIAVWVLLPARWFPVDAGGTLLAMLFAVSGVGLLSGQPWATKVAKLAAGIGVAAGVILVAALAITAGHLSGLYGPVGMGGSIILTAVAFLLIPYFVVFPAAQLYILLGEADDDRVDPLPADALASSTGNEEE